MRRPFFDAAVLAALLSALPATPSAQAAFFEGFNNKTVSDLTAEGWSFRNQSSPVGQLGWRPDDRIQPYEGTHYLVTDGYCMGGGGTGVVGSNWALLPAMAGQVAGDPLVLYLSEGWSSTRGDVLEVRYSPSGGTSTGAGPNEVGSFTTLLETFVYNTLGAWAPHTITLPGPGRIALRYYVPNGRAASMYVDALSVGMPPAGSLPMPQPGELVHWDASLSPIQLPAGVSNIVAGGSVVVDPGVEVRLASGSTLTVEGSLQFLEGTTLDAEPGAVLLAQNAGALSFLGTPAAPIVVRGDEGYYTAGLRAWSGATLAMRSVDAQVFGWLGSSATAVVEDCVFTKGSTAASYAPGFRVYDATLAIRGSSFSEARIVEEKGYLLFDGSDLTASTLEVYRLTSPQPLWLNGIVATGHADAPIVVHNFDVALGPDNVLQGNGYAVRLETGGLWPGSIVPTSGNANDWIPGLARFGSRATWPSVGLPYVLDWDSDIPQGSGRLTIEPGVTARFRRGTNTVSDSFAVQFFADLECRGTPSLPILLTSEGADWGGLAFGNNTSKRPRLEHTVVSNADTGVIATLCDVRLESAQIVNCDRGAQANSSGSIVARGSLFMNNAVGLETSAGTGTVGINAGQADVNGQTNPSSFVGNGEGLRILNPNITQVDARYDWWGDATGPLHPTNPGGLGDSASAAATITPFLVNAPSADQAPQVYLQPLASILEEGTKVILRWDVQDDGSVVSQRIEYSPHGSNPPLAPLVSGIAGDVRTLEIVVPPSPPSSNTLDPVLRVVAVDDSGKEGWDEVSFFTPYEDFNVGLAVATPPAVLRPGEQASVCWSGVAGGSAYLQVEDVDWAFSLGGTTTSCLSLGLTAPGVSTDLARVAVAHTVGAGGRIRYEYSDYFSIRPDATIGDQPPTVQLAPLAPSYGGGTVIPIAWTASDDEGLRSFTVQASYDGGRAWNTVARGLPGTSRSFAWSLPPSTGIDDLRLRVVAHDLRFQASSDTARLAVTPGSGPDDPFPRRSQRRLGPGTAVAGG